MSDFLSEVQSENWPVVKSITSGWNFAGRKRLKAWSRSITTWTTRRAGMNQHLLLLITLEVKLC